MPLGSSFLSSFSQWIIGLLVHFVTWRELTKVSATSWKILKYFLRRHNQSLWTRSSFESRIGWLHKDLPTSDKQSSRIPGAEKSVGKRRTGPIYTKNRKWVVHIESRHIRRGGAPLDLVLSQKFSRWLVVGRQSGVVRSHLCLSKWDAVVRHLHLRCCTNALIFRCLL